MFSQTFNYYNQIDIPSFVLCQPDKTQLKSITVAVNKTVTLKYNALSEFSFEIPEKTDIGKPVDGYDLIQAKRLVLIENIGYFRIDKVNENLDGIKKVKNVKCFALEAELIQKKLNAFGGTFKLYDITSPSTTLLGRILQLIPTWSIGTVDASLTNKFRTFNVSDLTIYGFLMNQVETAYGCIFVFDTDLKTISAIDRNNATYNSDVYLSTENLITALDITEIADEITTAMYVYGAGALDIRTVNPLGTNLIYNFDYYMTTDWMSQGLITAITNWQTLIDTNQPVYVDNLTLLRNYNGSLLVLNSELAVLQNQLTTLEGLEKVRIESNQPFEDIVLLINAKLLEITAKQNEITVMNANITSVTATLTSINTSLSFDVNFTPTQLLELNNFIIENTYQNENFVQTSIMTAEEVQDAAQSLYDQGVEVLEKLSQPRYEFSIDAVNFLFLKEYEIFSDQLQLGSVVTIEKEEDEIIETILLEIKINYDNPSDFSMTFSNRLRLDGAGYIYSDLFGQSVKTSGDVSFGSVQWSEWTSNYEGPVSSFITSALNASVNKLINAQNQEVTVDANGLRGKQYIPETQSYSPQQVWLTSKVLAFTTDAWNTAKAALGEVEINGTTYYGLVAEAVFGRLLAGNQLTIANEGNNFTLDANGAVLNNAKFNLNDADNKVTITISPIASTVHGQNLDPGFTIQSNILGTWVKTFYVDSSGNAVFAGNLSGATGSFTGSITANSGLIGGLTINSQGIQKDANNYIRSNGDLKWGALSIVGGVAVFDGTIKANKITGEVDWSQIVNAPLPSSKFNGGTGYSANGLTTGAMLGNRISGGTINNADLSWGLGAVTISSPGGGQGLISGSTSIRLAAGGGATVVVSGANVSLAGTNFIFTGTTLNLNSVSSISTASGVGITTTQTISVPGGTKILRIKNGIVYGLA